MEKKVDEKLDSLTKYLPFINYLLQLDGNKYKKLKDIQHWILSRKRYPMNVLQKIEQSIITQYRNLFYDDGKVPKHIMAIFNTHAHVKCFRVNLCSDDEDNVENSSDIQDDDDDVIIISTSPNTQDVVQPQAEIANQCVKDKVQEAASPSQCGKNKEQEETSKPALERCIIDEPICIDSDDDEALNSTVPVENELFVKEEQLFKRRGDFIDKFEDKEKSKEDKYKATEQETTMDQQNELNYEKSNPTEIAELHHMQKRRPDLENMHIDKLKQMYEDLTKEIGIDVEQLLKRINLISTQIENNKNKSPQDDFDSSPNYTSTSVPVILYPEVYANEIPPNVYNMQPRILPPQTPLRLNLKDPRIVKLLERNKTLHMISMGIPARNVSNVELPKSEPSTYGEYKRLKAEKAKKAELKRLEEAKRAEELRRKEEANTAEELRRIDEARRTEELRRTNEAKRAEELRRIEEAKKAEELKRIEEMKKTEELRSIEEAKRAKDSSTMDEVKKAEELRRMEEAKRAEELRRMVEAKRVEELIESWRNSREDNVNKAEDKRITDKTKRGINVGKAKLVRKSKEMQTGPKMKLNDVDNNTTLSKENSKEVPYQSTETSSNTTVLNEGTETSNVEQQTDLRRIILNTILPYGDKILHVLRTDNDLQALNGKIIALGNSEKVAERKTETNPSSVSHQISSAGDTAVNASDQNNKSRNNVQNEHVIEEQIKCVFNSKKSEKSKKRPREAKDLNTKSTYKRMRSISSSSSTTSESSSMSSTTTTLLPTLPSAGSTSVPLNKKKRESQPLVYKPVVKLRRLSAETILKYTKMPLGSECKTIHIRLVEDVKKTKKTVHHLVTDKPTKLNVKYKNVDILMTYDNTKFCVLCKSKPSDLTNHYKRVHKTESYVARLSRSVLHNLVNNIPFAQKLAKVTNHNLKKYLVKCVFCQEEIEDKFINFYNHFSIHTGEYAFQCDICNLEKPYKFDIQSHKCHSKSCRNAAIRTLYQYPPNVLAIYLYCCKICNFVQLNEANTFKHLRDHHDKRQDDSSCIKRYLLTAINDEDSCEKSPESDTNYELLMKDQDEDILVKNEAIVEDVTDFHKVEKEQVEANESTLLRGRRYDFKGSFSNGLTMVELPYTKYYKYSSILNQDMLSQTSTQQNDGRPIVLSSVENLVNSSAAPSLEYIKTEFPDILPIPKENHSCKKLLQNSSNLSYRQYPNDVSYFGLYKCMAIDCLYSTDAKEEILQHLKEHLDSKCPPEGCLLCAYCQLDTEICSTPEMLIEHIQKNHQQSPFQCSVCCYRGISPSHVSLHFKHTHPEQELQIVYQCALDIILDTSVPTNIAEFLEANVEPLHCPLKDCVQSFQSVIWMKNHLMHAHYLPIKSECITALEKYACIYCTMNFYDLEMVKNHLVIRHPEQQPYVCERVLLPEKEEDSLQNLTVTFVSLPIIPVETIRHVKMKKETDMASYTTEMLAIDQTKCDTKPNLEQLVQTAEESVKLSLLKLIGNTGIPPNLLYHCPQPTCCGFFSSYDLWHRHMSLRHCCLLSICPHCVNDKKIELPLVDFKEHFQLHCCHLYCCFHCGETFSNEQASRDHITLVHIDIKADASAIRMEKVPLYFNQPFNILLKSGSDKDRYTFLLELQDVVQNRCKYVDKLHYDSLKTQWIVSCTATWLENFPSFKSNERIRRKCFCQNCSFQTHDNEMFYAHLRESHRVNDSKFVCAKCDFHVACENWEPIIDHIKMHVLNIHICSVCSYYQHDRQKICEHLSREHRFRDVPIVTIIRSSVNTQISLAIVFAQQRKTFSTIKRCFCCNKSSDSRHAFATHLKKAHHLTLQYFCEICDESLKLKECDVHFTNCHPTTALRIRCQIATNTQISIDSIMPLKLIIEPNDNDPLGVIKIIKQEPCDIDTDSDIELLNDDDIVIEKDVKMCEIQQKSKDIRCVNVKNLQSQHTNVGRFETHMMPQPPLSVAVPIPHTHSQSQSQPQLQLQSQFIPQFVPPVSETITADATNTNTALFTPRIAIHSQNSNFVGDYNYRSVKLLINTTANSPNNNYSFQNFQP